MSPQEFTLTHHAISRLRERHPDVAKDLDSKSKDVSPAIKKKMLYNFFHGSKEERGFLNDVRFMLRLRERYGFEHDFHLFVRGDVVFVGVRDEKDSVIVTTLHRVSYKSNHVRHQNKKWKKRETSDLQ
jgi:hypothetical protein